MLASTNIKNDQVCLTNSKYSSLTDRSEEERGIMLKMILRINQCDPFPYTKTRNIRNEQLSAYVHKQKKQR